MTFRYTDAPLFHPHDSYLSAIDRMVRKLMGSGKVMSVFQVGGVSTPGISDVDLYVVFKDNGSWADNPVAGLPEPDQYFFIHRLFGTTADRARHMEKYTLFGSYNHLAGEPFDMMPQGLRDDEIRVLKHQIALEYLVKAWISINVSIKQGVIKLRNLLLHAKAINYDIAFLEIKNPQLIQCINDLMEVRNTWFTDTASSRKMDELVTRYQTGLELAILESLNRCTFYHANPEGVRIGRNITLSNGNSPGVEFSGTRIPSAIASSSRLMARLAQRMGHYKFRMPMAHTGTPGILVERQKKVSEAIRYNEKYLPAFLCTAYAMNTFH